MIATCEARDALMGCDEYAQVADHGGTYYSKYRQPNPRWETLFAKIKAFRDYEDDWDDEGGIPPSQACIAHVEMVAKDLRADHCELPRCHATNEGHIVLCIDSGLEYTELEFNQNLQVDIRSFRRDSRQFMQPVK